MSKDHSPSRQEEELFTSPMMYRLLRAADGSLAIEVVVGTIAMSTVRVQLAADEAAAYHGEGRAATDRLAEAIVQNPKFFGRAVAVP
jgi:hypothetical protein